MFLEPGTRIGVYEIEASLGVGGMGEVYRARDTTLGRRVAIKILPDAFSQDPERVARFEREAQVLAVLNHPHIAQIYSVVENPAVGSRGDSGSGRHNVRALVMELVDGSTLADRLVQGAIPLDEAIQIARQISDALHAAHDQGIVHRDLKPSNIALTSDGTVKVLDFGLAKPSEAGPVAAVGGISQSPTITSPALMTGAGVILGTAAYMSPEQAKGRAADKRSDVWAFGCVLYEMLTGSRLFGGDDVSDTLAFVLTREPDWSALPRSMPSAVRTLLERCLAKDPRSRAADMSLVSFLLEPSSRVEPAKVDGHLTRRELLAWSACAIAALSAAALAVIHFREIKPAAPPSIQFGVVPSTGLTFTAGNSGGVLSPDGRHILFSAGRAAGAPGLVVHTFSDGRSLELPSTDGGLSPFWSPDSRSVAFVAEGKLKRVSISGGAPQVICDAPGVGGGAWAPEGTIVFSPGSGRLLRVPASGGMPAPVTMLDETREEQSHLYPWFLPDGRHFLYIATAAKGAFIHVGSLDDTSNIVVTSSDTRAVYADGYLLYIAQDALLAQPFDASRMAAAGDPVVLVRNVMRSGSANLGADFSASTAGILSYRLTSVQATQLMWVDRSGRQLEIVGSPSDQAALSLSPDGSRVAVSVLEPTRRSRDIWIHDLTRNVRTRFTLMPDDEWSSAWSPDGKQLVFSAAKNGIVDLYRKATDGSGPEVLISEAGGNNKFASGWFEQSRGATPTREPFVLFNTGRSRSPTGNDIWVLPIGNGTAPTEQPRPIAQTPYNELQASLSPDGRWLAMVSDESGRPEITVVAFPGPGGKWQVSTNGGALPTWSRDGREIFYVERGSDLMAADVNGQGAAFQVGAVRRLFEARFRTENYVGYGTGQVYQAAPDGKRFLVNVVDGDRSPTVPITVITAWTSMLTKDLP